MSASKHQVEIDEELSKIKDALSDRRNNLLSYVDRVGNNLLFKEKHLAELYFIVKIPQDYPKGLPKYSFEVEKVAIRKFVNENPRTDVTLTRVVLRRIFEISMARQLDIPEKIIELEPGFIEEIRREEAKMTEL
ncbi:unnamed protein product [Rodentolepis nana]|uniref:RWD domain-containing protein n=1 Tax=Rodentolepis nana TaxID=102285 RepID=A0A0R3TWP3_RODNA|nr:unnamed protein product [Rodentolepis nana]